MSTDRTAHVLGFVLAALLCGGPAGAQDGSTAALQSARRLIAQGRLDEAMNHLEAAVTADPDHGPLRCEYGRAAFRSRQLPLAARQTDEGLALLAPSHRHHERGARLDTRGRIAEEQGDLAGAARFYERSLGHCPGVTGVERRLRSVRERAGRLRLQPDELEELRPRRVTVSSHTPGADYLPQNAIDGDRSTGWQVSSRGVGQWLRLEFGQVTRLGLVGVVAGYDKLRFDRYGDRWPLNNRVSSIRLEYEGGSTTATLDDDRALQWIDLGSVDTRWVRLVITGVRPGSRWNDTVLSEVRALGRSAPVAAAPAVEVDQSGGVSAQTEPAPEPAPEPAAAPELEPAATTAGAPSSGGDGRVGLVIEVASVVVVAVMLLLVVGRITSWRRREEAALLRRAREAHRSVEAEVANLGEAFVHVLEATSELRQRAEATVEQVHAVQAALHRTRKLSAPGTSDHRGELLRREQAALVRLAAIADRLEETALHLAARAAGGDDAGVEPLLERLHRELDTAVTADDEARAVLDDGSEPPPALGAGPERPRRSPPVSATVVLGVIFLGSLTALAASTGRGEAGLTVASTPSLSEPPEPEAPGRWVSVWADHYWRGTSARGQRWAEDEKLHLVHLSRPFLIQATEVTQGQFTSLMGYNPSGFDRCGDTCPVERVSWHEAAAYANALSRAEDRPTCYQCSGEGRDVSCAPRPNPVTCLGYRLPTEAEWEYAAAGARWPRPHDPAQLSTRARLQSNSQVDYEGGWPAPAGPIGPSAVASLSPNHLGLFDMQGNVWEWCHDFYGEYPTGPAVDPTGPDHGSARVIRGGSWYSNARDARLANRSSVPAWLRYDSVGFRLVRSLV